MQQIAREFNFSESTFVFPAKAGHARHVRIFTPAREIPFAGHPNVGTAFVLASTGEFGDLRSSLSVTFEEGAGLMPVTIREEKGRVVSCELKAPAAPTMGRTVSPSLVASAVSLDVDDIVTRSHQPQEASVGLPFLMVELKDGSALERSRLNMAGFDTILAEGIRPSVYLYTRASGDADLRVRMFAPLS